MIDWIKRKWAEVSTKAGAVLMIRNTSENRYHGDGGWVALGFNIEPSAADNPRKGVIFSGDYKAEAERKDG